jgi:hypothetical protein
MMFSFPIRRRISRRRTPPARRWRRRAFAAGSRRAIVDAITGARIFVLIFSGNANASVQIKREVERAINRAIPVIPLRIENVTPTKSLEYFLSTPHWLDAFSPPLQQHLDYLSDVSRSILTGQAVPAAPARPVLAAPVAVDRRLLIGGGAAALLAVTLGGYLMMPHGAPSFVGKWTAEKIEIGLDMPSPFAAFPINAFYKAALASKTLTGTFEVNEASAYTFVWGGEDRGTVTVNGRTITFISDQTHRPVVMSYGVLNPSPGGAVAALGGEAGDSALALSAAGGALAMLLGPASGPGPAGHWSTHTPAMGIVNATSTSLDIGTDGHYRFHFEFAESGILRWTKDSWSRERPGVPPVTGTLSFEGKNRVTAAGGGGVTVWVRNR